MSLKFTQGRFKLEASVNVVSTAPEPDEISIDHAKLYSHVLEGWWMEVHQEIGDVPHGGTALNLIAYHKCAQLLPFRCLQQCRVNS